ncbi:putative oxoglutarate iron-dependent oxygenase [Erysiphe neolycopersici]|uniref:Putative oxoglutarate iron-dependent oxygenase n=1 Tax=Erysiphe neolycopersici TaxID=212602 RepID=A0A420HUM4_9PEZI|nr:putative oxoglutarate iron-dependent oxygenase [Erysiphe neolycopersici]
MAAKKNASRTLKPKTTLSSLHKPLDWPLFSRQLPTSSLSLESLLPSQIIVIHKFWSENLCKNYVRFLKTLPLVTTGKPKKGEAVRFNDRFQINDTNFAHRLWTETGLRELICGPDTGHDEIMNALDTENLWGGEVIGLNPNIRIYRYSKDDESSIISLETKGATTVSAVTTWTLLLYLTSPVTGCKGGETVFYPNLDLKKDQQNLALDKVEVTLETGMILLHKHGKECLLHAKHEGKEVLEGEKWVIRTDLCVKR